MLAAPYICSCRTYKDTLRLLWRLNMQQCSVWKSTSPYLFLLSSRVSIPGHHSSSREVQPALNSSVGMLRDGARADTGVLGACEVVRVFLILELGCVLGFRSPVTRLFLVLSSVLHPVSGFARLLKLLLRLKALMLELFDRMYIHQTCFGTFMPTRLYSVMANILPNII